MEGSIHINCDMGESFGRYQLVDEKNIMPLIDSCNIACGFHAGDPQVIDKTIILALRNDVQIGAHPSFPDRQGFGRRLMKIHEEELECMIRYQMSALIGMVKSNGGEVNHVKAHGALYNLASKDLSSANAIVKAAKKIDPNLIIYAPFQSVLAEVGISHDMKIKYEAFVDRRYNSDGSLVNRNLPGAVIHNPKKAWEQVRAIYKEQKTPTVQGETIHLKADTFCIHGDNEAALSILEYIKNEKD